MKRCFITTGLISLLNALTIVKMQGGKHEDFLIIYSFAVGEKFIAQNTQLAKLHDWQKIEILHDWKETTLNLEDFDEIYAVDRILMEENAIFHKVKTIAFDEGISFVEKHVVPAALTYYTNHLGKFLSVENIPNVELSKTIFLELCKQAQHSIDPSNIVFPPQKRALVTGQWILDFFYSPEEKAEFYKPIITTLIDKGFVVYFKKHPREKIDSYQQLAAYFPDNFHFLMTDMPVEFYDLDFTVVLSATCNTLFSLPHFRNIPSGYFPCEPFCTQKINVGFWQLVAYASEYIPLWKDLLQGVTRDMSHAQAKELLQRRFWEHVASKPNTRENKKIREVFLLYIDQPAWRRHMNKFLGKMIAGVIPNKEKRHKFRNKEYIPTRVVKKRKE